MRLGFASEYFKLGNENLNLKWVDDLLQLSMGMPMQNDTEAKTEIDPENVVDDSGKTIEEINEEIERELEVVAEEVEVAEEALSPEAQMEADLLKWKETAMRTAADLENFSKRMAREKGEAIKFGNQRLIEELLPVIDNFSKG